MWTPAREQGMILWVRQLVALSYLYSRASSWFRVLNFVSSLLSVIGTVYSIPTYGCSLVSREVCTALLWSGLISSFIVGTSSVLASIYSPSERARECDDAAKGLLKVSRMIDEELARGNDEREDAGSFSERVLRAYDTIVDHVPLPWFVHGEQQLANLSLIQSFTEQQQRNNLHDDVGSPRHEQQQQPQLLYTAVDREIARRIDHELGRLAQSSSDIAPLVLD
jgi:hypothetical protein